MEIVPVIFSRNGSLFSALIRLFTWSRWSHCGIIHGDKVIEATFWHGVVATPLHEFQRRYKTWSIQSMPTPDSTSAIKLAMAELGKPYDKTAIISLVLRRRWQQADSWFCSELLAHASGMYRRERLSRVTPEHIWMICK